MTDYTWPSTIIPASAEWRLIAATASFGPRTLARAGDRWACTLSLPMMTREASMPLRAFLSRLRGHSHRVVLPNHAYRRNGSLTTNALVRGGGQTGTTLNCDGVEAFLPAAVRAGDFVTVAGRLYMVAADADTTAGGRLALTLCNPVDDAPDDNATVEILSPTGRFILTGEARWQNIPGGLTQVMPLEFLEDIA